MSDYDANNFGFVKQTTKAKIDGLKDFSKFPRDGIPDLSFKQSRGGMKAKHLRYHRREVREGAQEI